MFYFILTFWQTQSEWNWQFTIGLVVLLIATGLLNQKGFSIYKLQSKKDQMLMKVAFETRLGTWSPV